ncbi:MAG TPA: hypothetical protein VM434_00765 [Beijerinckiaceae bacterium]|nr:hypothetical protein [Beijerinckiaceae bacterium]
MIVGAVLVALGLAAGSAAAATPAATVLDCAVEAQAEGALAESGVTETVLEGRGAFSAEFAQDRAAATLAFGEAVDPMRCTPAETTRALVCATARDRKVLVLFPDGRFLIANEAGQDRWTTAAGACRPRIGGPAA